MLNDNNKNKKQCCFNKKYHSKMNSGTHLFFECGQTGRILPKAVILKAY